MKQPIFLRIYQDGKLENVKQFTEEQVVIGRNTDLLVSLKSDEVSPLHAVIEERESGYYISDLGSDSGTFKNGQKIFDEKIESGDEIKIGSYVLEFFIGVPKPKKAPEATMVKPVDKPDFEKPELTKTSLESKPTSQPTPPPPRAPKIPDDIPEQPEITKVQPKKKEVPTAQPGLVQAGALIDRFKKSEGAVVQVVTAWGDRVINTHHFSKAQEITIGSDPTADIVVPLPGLQVQKFPLLKLGPGVKVRIHPQMKATFYKGDKYNDNVSNEVDLQQGEMLHLTLNDGEFSIFVRFGPDTVKPLVAPVLDFTASESTAVILAGVIAAIFSLFMAFYSPVVLEDEDLLEQPLRKAVVTFNAPKRKRVVKVSDQAQKKKVNESKEKKAVTTNPDPGKAGELRPNRTTKKSNQPSSTVKQGGAKKISNQAGANVKSKPRKEVKDQGLLSVFGSRGAQKELSKAYSGTGELQGLAASASGKTGQTSDRAGDQLGGRLKDIGVGGKGTSTSGFSGVGTKGKGTGTFGYGTGGIGERGQVDINIEGSDAEFRGSIDKDAIRRVIQQNKRAFRFCYETALRANSDLYGRLEIQWDIVEGGRVQRASVKSNSTGNRKFGECVAGKIRGLIFPEPPADEIARVVYPFVFTAQ